MKDEQWVTKINLSFAVAVDIVDIVSANDALAEWYIHIEGYDIVQIFQIVQLKGRYAEL